MDEVRMDEVLETLRRAGAEVLLVVDGQQIQCPLAARRFSTGSAGFGWAGKLDGRDGRRYQVSLNVTLIGSKGAA